MSEKKHIESDLMMRSILNAGRENVPDHVWDDISMRLDDMAGRRKVLLLFRRIGVASAAAAAIIAGVLAIHHTEHEDILPAAEEGLISVIKTPESIEAQETVLLSHIPARHQAPVTTEIAAKPAEYQAAGLPATPQETEIKAETAGLSEVSETPERGTETEAAASPHVTDPADFIFPEEPEPTKKNRIRTAITFSGIAGTNTPGSNMKSGIMKRPSIPSHSQQTPLITQTTDKTIYGIPLSFGMGARISFSPKWALGIGVNYTLLTSKFNGSYNLGVTSIGSDIRNSQHYVGIPVNAYYNIVKKDFLNFYAYAGGTVEKCVGNNYQVLKTAYTHKESVKGLQVSANIGFGLEFMVTRYLGLYIDPSLRYYFDTGQPSSIRTAQPLMLGFEMGCRFHI